MPPDAPHTCPPASTVATVVLPLVHVPPLVASISVIDDPEHTADRPVIAPGAVLITTVTEAVQPPSVYIIVALPAVTPDTRPPEVTVATAVLLLVHVPPVAASVNKEVAPEHIPVEPRIAAGDGVTVITRVTVQPEPREYVIVTGPGVTPVTVPAEEPVDITVAIVVLLLIHEPPGGVSLSSTLAPTHTVAGPVIGPGEELTVTTVVAVQPAVVV